jgi:hypothetical protein
MTNLLLKVASIRHKSGAAFSTPDVRGFAFAISMPADRLAPYFPDLRLE